ncbi:MAG TPA: hypothetical protein VD994_14710 [Prosthecobacter sp.]|nr:hypothetical protein [Prosthecobacter sp.]
MKIILTLTAFIIAASTSFAAEDGKGKGKGEGKRDPEAMFKRLDANSDGAVSKEEWNEAPFAKKDADRAAKGFAAKDKDGDGKLSKEEFTAAPKGKK